MSVLRHLLAGALMAGCAVAAPAQTWHWAADAGLPRSTIVEGRPLAWQPVLIAVETPGWDLEARLPACLPGTPCASAGLNTPTITSPLGRSWQWHTRLDSGLGDDSALDVSARQWSASRGERGRSPGGSAVEAEWVRDLAHGSVSAGWTEPVGPGRRSGWRSAFAALDWQVDEHRSLSVLVDHSATRDGERTSRSVRVRWDTAGSGGLRWRLQAVRQWDDLERPWVAGASIDWHF